jgi:uncharacterized protein involved in exopolysaccharide biosynthesis
MITAVISAILLIGGAIFYVASLKTEIAVANAEIKALRKSQDSWTGALRDEIRRVETSLESRLTRLSEVAQGRRPP